MMSGAMNKLQELYIPMLEQLKPESIRRDGARCYATFDGSVCTGDLVAVECDEYCLITRYRIEMVKNVELAERFFRSLCILSYSVNCEYAIMAHARGDSADEGSAISVFIQPRFGDSRKLKAGCVYEATRITYLPGYFEDIDFPSIGTFDDISALIPKLDEELLSLRLRGLLEDLDFDAAQKPTGTYYYRSRALEAVCHVMDMVSELGALASSGVNPDELRFVRRVMEIVESSLDDLPSIYELSERIYVGHTYLCETFKSIVGLTVGEYARQRRIETAKVLLRNPSLPIKEVARRTGYRTTGGFSAAFKQMEGMTPRQYRMTMIGQRRQVL